MMTMRVAMNTIIAESKNADLVEFAVHELEKLDTRNAKRAERPSKKAIENEPIKAEILKVLTDTPQTASAIAERIGISTQKASALLRQIGGLEVTEIKVPKKGTQKGYALAQ